MLENVTLIHPAAFVDPGARLGAGVRVGPGTMIGRDVLLGDGVEIGAHAVLEGRVDIGARCRIGHGAIIGARAAGPEVPTGTPDRRRIGEDTVIREYATIHRATHEGRDTTSARHCLLMATVPRGPRLRGRRQRRS